MVARAAGGVYDSGMSFISQLLVPGDRARPARPVIGINLDFEDEPRPRSFVRTTYYDAVHAAGGLPVLLPPIPDEALVSETLARLDGLILTGGDDLDPCHWGEEKHPACKLLPRRRESFDMLLGRVALGKRIPLLAICCGTQLVNVLRGGSLIQDIPSLVKTDLVHSTGDPAVVAEHEVEVHPGTRLREIVGLDRLRANSVHHQSCGRMGAGLVVSARASDGVVEAYEDPEHPFLIALQWHPERMTEHAPHMALFRALVDAARAAEGRG